MRKIIRVELVLKIQTEEKDFESYYNNDKSILYNICYMKEKGKLYNPIDMDTKFENGLYIINYYFKLSSIEKTPKISYGLHIFENGKKVKSEVKIILINSELIDKGKFEAAKNEQ